MDSSYATVYELLDKLTETNEAWHNKESEVGGGSSLKNVLTREMVKKEEERDESMAKLVTQMDLLTKHVMGGESEKVNAVGSCEGGSPDEQCFQMYDKEASYINNQREGSQPNYQGPNQGSWRQGQEKQGSNKDQGNSSWKDSRDNNQRGYNNYQSSNPYVPPKGNQQISSQPPTSDPVSSKIEDMLLRVLKKVKYTYTFCKETRDEVKSIGQVGLLINIPLVKALEQMPGYTKFMKDLVTKRRSSGLETMGGTHHCSAIVTKALVQKKEDPGAFTIPCTIGKYKFAKALCDLGASINLMPLAIFNKLGLGTPLPTTMRLLMADRTMKRPVGILYDVLVRVDRFCNTSYLRVKV
ncbi:uncharacterized protein LOC132048757 [Lycium ferocissimum]|uniref:uncharacterized protein LOC132048757 n=1 Tax=Lycium ferocissimum TaxID=112874 RepID=UPI0028149799|nr:uncharacterized protein LOC132048757 [Lycium ferocissimum]